MSIESMEKSSSHLYVDKSHKFSLPMIQHFFKKRNIFCIVKEFYYKKLTATSSETSSQKFCFSLVISIIVGFATNGLTSVVFGLCNILFQVTVHFLLISVQCTLIKRKRRVSSNITKFRGDWVQSHDEGLGAKS